MLKKIINLGIIVPIGYLAVTTIAINVGGLNPVATMALLVLALIIGTFTFREVGPVVFGPGIGGATIVAPLLLDYGHIAAAVAIGLVGIIQLLLGAHKTFLGKIHPPKDLKILILFVLAFYLLHKPQVAGLLDKVAHTGDCDSIHAGTNILIAIFMVLLGSLALKPFFPNKIPDFISLGNILGLAFVVSILTVGVGAIHEPSILEVLLLVEILEGYFNYKTATLLTHYEEPPTAIRYAFLISGALNSVAAVIGAGPVMTGLIKVSLFQESGGQNRKQDLMIVLAGTIVIALLYVIISQYFAQWLFAALLLFVGLKLLVKAITELTYQLSHVSLTAVNPWRAYWLVGVVSIFFIVFTIHKNPLMWGIVFSIGFTILRNIIAKLASKSDPAQELHTH
jgi:hypothetical protein